MAINLLMLPPALDREFLILLDGDEICRGYFVSFSSSKTYQGPTIMIDATGKAPSLRSTGNSLVILVSRARCAGD